MGRGVEVGRLLGVLEGLSGGAAVVDVAGDAGIGKSRLLAEFGALARARGMAVLRGRAVEGERGLPSPAFQVFLDAFADLETVDVVGVRSFRALLRTVSRGGLVLLLDDLHRADPASLELLDHLVRHPLPAPLLLVISRRPRQSPPALSSALARGVDTGVVTRIPLGPLGIDDCVDAVAPGVSAELVRENFELSRGNPFYFLGLLPERSGAGVAQALLLDELSPLSALERRLVEAVAVLGEHATTDLLGAVTEVDDTALVEALREVVRRDLVRTDPGGHRLELRHPLMRGLVCDSVDPWRRRRLHRRAAAELALAGASVVDQAHHVERSLTRWDAAGAAVLIEAAERSAVGAPALAARWLDVVLGVLPYAPEHLDTRRELMLARARALGTTGAVKESRDLLHRLIGSRGSDGQDPLRAAALVECAFIERHLGRYPEAGALLHGEMERCALAPPGERSVALVVEWGNHALFSTRFPEARAELAHALLRARERSDELGAAEVLTLSAIGEAYEGNTAVARRHVAAATALIDVLTDGDLVGQCESLVRLAWSEVFLDEYADAERHTRRGADVARRTGRPFALSQHLLCAAYAHVMTGRVTTALELADESEAVARTLGGRELLGFTRAIRSMILMHARPPGDPDVLAAAEEGVATIGAVDGWWATLARCMSAYAVLGAGDPHRVRDVLLRAGGGRDLPRLQPSVRPNFLELLVTAALATRDLADAEYWARRAVEEAGQLELPTQRGAALRCLGLLDAARGEPAAAARAFSEAARESARSGATLREAHSLLLGAPHLKAAGDGPGAAAMWRRGRRLADEGAARLLVGLADRIRPGVLGSGGAMAVGGGGIGGAGDVFSSLTPREREISELVAEGLTNQAVADRLCLSTRTVESHVARVYRKTGVPSRAALAALVARLAGDRPSATA
ncbi:LuxR C-terminal-related transcriptional regulator [Streptomyces sp. NPDC050617]|uniref:helix-turn-helix transcriptional regulator n=1 Tax=Streptomyces sp. NPDC050617 TaxID=3154628 RepID=UPI00344689AB